MTIRIVFTLVLCLLALALGSGSAKAAALTTNEASLVGAVNAIREARGLPALSVDARLVRAARAYSTTLLRRDMFAHGDLGPRLDSYGVSGPRYGENLAWGVGARTRARTIVREWLASPGHRANLLRPGFRRIGIGARVGKFLGHRGATVVTADFAG